MSRTARIILAVFTTLLISPCLGFGLFGLAASQEPGTGIGWTIGYIVFELVLLGLIIVTMRAGGLLSVLGILVGISFLFSGIDLLVFSAAFHGPERRS